MLFFLLYLMTNLGERCKIFLLEYHPNLCPSRNIIKGNEMLMHLNLAGFGRQDKSFGNFICGTWRGNTCVARCGVYWFCRVFVWAYWLDRQAYVSVVSICEHVLNISIFLHGRGLFDQIEIVRPLSQIIYWRPRFMPFSLSSCLSTFPRSFPSNSTSQFASKWFLLRGAWLRICVHNLTFLCFTGFLSLCRQTLLRTVRYMTWPVSSGSLQSYCVS